MNISIEFCKVWNYEPRAAGLAAELKQRFQVDCEMIPSGGGVYEVSVDADLIFSKKALGRFPEDGEIVRLIEAR